jgi:glutamyl-tRNA synthetase
MAVVIDDYLMKISHVIRAEEWISSTPKHILLYKAFDWELPIFVHLPILRNPDKSKLSKRKNPVWASWYLKMGFLPEAVLNYLALMGWSHPQGKEIFSIEEFIQILDLKKISPVGPAFDKTKLEWMNGEYIRKMPDEELTKRLQDFLVDHPAKEKIGPVVPLIKERIKTLSDFIPLTDFLFEKPEYEPGVFAKVNLEWKEILKQALAKLEELPKPWEKENFETTFQELAKKLNISNTVMFQLIRAAVSGQLVTPPLFESIKILGEEETSKRIENVIRLDN